MVYLPGRELSFPVLVLYGYYRVDDDDTEDKILWYGVLMPE